MTLQQLRVLVAVVEEGSFTRGAQAVYMTQSAASQHVRSLEQALGVVLLERTGSAVLPTSAGSGLVRYAQEILRTAADAERFVGAMRQGRGGRLALGAGGSAVSLVPQLVAALRAAAPEVEVALRVAPRGDLEEGAARGTLDVVALSGPARRPGLDTAPLCADSLVLVAAPGTALLPAAALAPVPLSRVAEQPLIAPQAPAHSWRLVRGWAEAEGVELRPSLRLEGPESIKRAVEAGLGVAFLSSWVVEREVTLGTLRIVPVVPDVPCRRYELAHRAGREVQGPLATLLRVAPSYLRRRLPPGTMEGPPGADGEAAGWAGAPGRVA
jgi:LysR family transcriptional regulator, low CO2-responsive transcriptional regulator